MRFPKLTIEVTVSKETRRRRRKTRTFSARLLGCLMASGLWELGAGGEAQRPVWLAYFASPGAAKPFTANLRAGRRVTVAGGDRIEVPRSSEHRWSVRPVPGGVVTVCSLPELFHLEPPVPFTDDVCFVMAPSRRWVDEQAGQLVSEHGEDARDVVRAALFAAYVDRRTPLPLLRDRRFHLQLYRAAIEEPWVTEPLEGRFESLCDLDACRLDPPLACGVGGERFAEFLTAQTERFQREHGGLAAAQHGAGLSVEPGEVLPGAQLALAFGAA
jgi:hypothetical protein